MDPIGTVSTLAGAVHAEADDGSIRALAQGSPVYTGDEIVTASGAHVEILFKDETILAQGEDSRQEIDSYVYDPQDADSSNLLVNMTQGTFRLVTGQIAKANPEGVDVKTPLATIGIRGTGVDFDIDGAVQKVGCFLYDNLDIVVTTAQGTRLINAVNQILNVLQDGGFGEIRSYEDFEKAFFKAAAPIINLPPDAQYGGQDGEGGDEDDGDSGQWGPDAGNNPGQDLPNPYAQALVDLFEALFGTPDKPTGMLAQVFVVLVDIVEPEAPIDPDDLDYLLGIAEEILEDASASSIDPDSDGREWGALAANFDADLQGDDSGNCYTMSSYTDDDGNVISVKPTTGNDFIRAYDGNDTLAGDEGNDLIFGGAGNDTVTAGDGDDTVYGGLGDDSIRGENDNDVLIGGSGKDTLWGEGGTDALEGNDGEDLLKGGLGSDSLHGGADDDTLYGEAGNDFLYGDDGNDLMNGDDGDDFLYGGEGNDSLDGGMGTDAISGGGGDDILVGGEGDDALSGGSGADQFVYQTPTEGGDTIADFTSGTDAIVLQVDDYFNDLTTSGTHAWVTSATALNSESFAVVGGTYEGVDVTETLTNDHGYVIVDGNGDVWYDQDATTSGNEYLLAHISGEIVHTDIAIIAS